MINQMEKEEKYDRMKEIRSPEAEVITMSTSEAQKRAVQKWQKEKTDLIRLRVPKGKKEIYQELAAKSGAKSLTAYIIALLEDKLKESESGS